MQNTPLISTKKLSFRGLALAAALAGMSLFSGCNDDDNDADVRTGIAYGPEVSVGNGKARGFVKSDDAGNPTAVGFTLTRGALENLPHGDQSFRLALPSEKATTPYNHISLDWASHGHPLPGIYDVPHFDMHFYMISEAEQNAIVMDDKMQRVPEARFLPPADRYVSAPGEGVPGMGKHWGDITSPELAQGKPFTVTLIYGSYDGKVIFHEPMIAHNWLQSRPAQFDTVVPILQPAAFQKTAHYPTQYSVSYDAGKGVYTISLTGLIARQQE